MARVNQIIEGDFDPPKETHWSVAEYQGNVYWQCTHCCRNFIYKGKHMCIEGMRAEDGKLITSSD